MRVSVIVGRGEYVCVWVLLLDIYILPMGQHLARNAVVLLYI